MDRAVACRCQRTGPGDGPAAFGGLREEGVDVDHLVAVFLEIESLGGPAQNGSRRLPAGRVDVSDDEPLQSLGEVVTEGREPVLVPGEKDLPDRLRVNDLRQRVDDRLEVLITVGLDVSGVS